MIKFNWKMFNIEQGMHPSTESSSFFSLYIPVNIINFLLNPSEFKIKRPSVLNEPLLCNRGDVDSERSYQVCLTESIIKVIFQRVQYKNLTL